MSALQHAGYARFAYNWALGQFRSGLSVGEWLSERTLRPRWNKVKSMIAPWGVELSQNSAKYAINDLGQAAESWGEYRGKTKAGQRSGRRVGFPRFKRRRHEQCFRADNGPDTVKVDRKVVVLPKIGPVAMVEQLRFEGSIREVTINRTTGTWFACFTVEDGQKAPPVKDGPTVGVDVGVGTMATCSDRTVVDNPKALSSALSQLRRVDKTTGRSRNVHGRNNHSNRRERLYARASPAPRPGSQRSQRQPSQGNHGDSQVGRPGGGGDAERGGHAPQPAAGSRHSGRWNGRIPGQVGIQVRMVRCRVHEGGTGGSHHRNCAPTVAGRMMA